LRQAGVDFHTSMVFGGQIRGEAMRLFLVYSAGNFIECQQDTPFLQIGETKYGRPILDRALRHDTPLAEAVKIACLSFDSTMKSNLGVAMPIDMLVLPAAADHAVLSRRIEHGDRYFVDLADRWAELLYDAATGLPNPPWMS
jgi:putative proteasome-type protease